MIQTYTSNDLLTLIYGETDTCGSFKIKQEILQNPELAKEYRELRSTKSILESHHLSPKKATISRILELSQKGVKELG